jgi:hypothetical protein
MGVSIVRWDAEVAEIRLRTRRRWRAAAGMAIGLILVSIIGDHLRAKNSFANDWARFDGREVQFVRVIDGESILVREGISDDLVTVKLLGIKSFGGPLEKGLADGADSQLAGQTIVLHLGPTRSRDESGRLLADGLLEDGDPVSARMVLMGVALADRSSSSAFLGAVERAQTQARRRGVGMWAK